MTDFGYSVEVAEGYDEAVLRTRLAMKGEGFSILTEMHVGGVLGPEAGDQRQYLIMGVWNPVVSQRDVDDDMKVAVHMPCNVVVHETESAAMVAALDPTDTVDVGGEIPTSVADDARAALGRVLERVVQPVS